MFYFSDSEEPPETLRDNRGQVTIPVKYEVGLIFVRYSCFTVLLFISIVNDRCSNRIYHFFVSELCSVSTNDNFQSHENEAQASLKRAVM